MRRLVLAIAVSLFVGCSTGEDVAATPGSDDTGGVSSDGTVDVADSGADPDTQPVEDSTVADSGVDTQPPDALDGSTPDSVVADTTALDTMVVDTASADTTVVDTTVADTTVLDTKVADTTVVDTTVADTFVPDTSVADTAMPDTTVVDTGPADTGPADTGPADTGPADTGPVSFAADIQPIFSARCTGCHSGGFPSGGMNLSSGVAYANIVNVTSNCTASLKRIVPSSRSSSLMWLKTSNDPAKCGSAMPFGGPGLKTTAPADFAKLERWIDEGALDN